MQRKSLGLFIAMMVLVFISCPNPTADTQENNTISFNISGNIGDWQGGLSDLPSNVTISTIEFYITNSILDYISGSPTSEMKKVLTVTNLTNNEFNATIHLETSELYILPSTLASNVSNTLFSRINQFAYPESPFDSATVNQISYFNENAKRFIYICFNNDCIIDGFIEYGSGEKYIFNNVSVKTGLNRFSIDNTTPWTQINDRWISEWDLKLNNTDIIRAIWTPGM